MEHPADLCCLLRVFHVNHRCFLIITTEKLSRSEVLFVTFALHEAVKQKNAYITSKLLFFGAEPMMKDTWGKTAFDYAKSRKYEEILQVFEVWRRSGVDACFFGSVGAKSK